MASGLDLQSELQVPAVSERKALRRRLLEARSAFVATPAAQAAAASLGRWLVDLVVELEPERLGLYWPMRSEYNAPAALAADPRIAKNVALALALPFVRREPVEMGYRAWSGAAPELVDGCGLPSTGGAPVEPDVVLVPCLGFTASGLRLGYGGGYFDRWLAVHPHVTAIGIGWSVGRLDADVFKAEAHDVPMALVVTEHGIERG